MQNTYIERNIKEKKRTNSKEISRVFLRWHTCFLSLSHSHTNTQTHTLISYITNEIPRYQDPSILYKIFAIAHKRSPLPVFVRLPSHPPYSPTSPHTHTPHATLGPFISSLLRIIKSSVTPDYALHFNVTLLRASRRIVKFYKLNVSMNVCMRPTLYFVATICIRFDRPILKIRNTDEQNNIIERSFDRS